MTKTNSHENDRPSPRGQKSTAKRRANDASKSSSLSLDGAENKRELAETFCESGADALLGGDVDDALDSYLRAVKLDPNSSVARAGLARAFLADERYKRAFEEADHAARFAELLGEVVSPSTKENLRIRVEAENGATQGKTDLAKKAKELGLDAIHDTVHEMARDEARHGKAFKGLLDRYFGK